MSMRKERGVTLVLFAIVLLALLTFTAFAIDLGGVYNARRQDQSAADSGALGGVNEALLIGTDDSEITNEVIRLVGATLEIDATALNWNSCTAADSDSIDLPVNGLSCITRNTSGDQLQVRLPTQQYDTFFAGVLGSDLDTFDHTAFAIASLQPVGFGGVLPLPIGAGTGGGDGYECVRTGTPSAVSDIPPCDDPESGQFGSLDFGLWDLEDCTGEPKERWATNVSAGIDHNLGLYTGDVNSEEDLCPGTGGALVRPNAASTDAVSGLTPFDVGNALFSGLSATIPGRLARFDSNITEQSASVGGYELDDNGLWEFITPGLDSSDLDDPATPDEVEGDVPESCEEHNFNADLTDLPEALANHLSSIPADEEKLILLQRCFSHYNTGTFVPADIVNADGTGFIETGTGCAASPCQGVVFGRNSSGSDDPDLFDIQYTSRFAYVPQFHPDYTLDDHTAAWDQFRAVYLQRLFGGQCASSCSFDFDPGVGESFSTAEDKASGLTVFVFARDMLPGELGYSSAVTEVGDNFAVRLIR